LYKKLKIEYLEFFKNRNDLTNRESQLVNEDLLKDKMCMNLRTGGSGGFCNDIHKNKFHAAGGKSVMKLLGKRHNERMITDLEYRKKVILKLKNNKSFLGKTHKEESKKNNIIKKTILLILINQILLFKRVLKMSIDLYLKSIIFINFILNQEYISKTDF
jgi:hypothetical protein